MVESTNKNQKAELRVMIKVKERDLSIPPPHRQDGVYACVVLAAGFMSTVISFGSLYSYGILYPALLHEFRKSKAKTAWLGSLAFVLLHFFGILSGKLAQRFGCRPLAICGACVLAAGFALTTQVPSIPVMYVTYSTVSALGGSFVWTATYNIVPKYFHKRRNLTVGVMVAGPRAGVIVMGPLIQVFVEHYHWRGAFGGMACMGLFISALGITFNPSVSKGDPATRAVSTGDKETGSGCCYDYPILRNIPYLVYVTSHAVNCLGHLVPSFHIGRCCEILEISQRKVAQIYLTLGLCSCVARVITGRVCEGKWSNARYIYQGAIFIGGISTILLPLATTYTGLMMYIVTYGVVDGVLNVTLITLMLNSVGDRLWAQGFAFWTFAISITIALGSPCAGFLVDNFSSYTEAFQISGAVVLLSGGLVFLVNCFKPPLNKQTVQLLEELLVTEKKLYYEIWRCSVEYFVVDYVK